MLVYLCLSFIVAQVSCSNRGILILGGWDNAGSAEIYTNNGSTVLPDLLPMKTTEGGAFMFHNQLLVVEGFYSKGGSYFFDFCKRTTKSGPALSVPRQWFAPTTINGTTAIACGGFSKENNRTLSTCEILSSPTDKWRLHPAKLNEPRFAHSSTAFDDGVVIVAGGCDPDCNKAENFKNSVEALVNGKWVRLANMTSPRVSHTAIALSTEILMICSGQSDTVTVRECEFYNRTANAWTPGPPMNLARSGNALVKYENQIYSIGGFGGGWVGMNSVERLVGSVWEMKKDVLREQREDAAVAVVDMDC